MTIIREAQSKHITELLSIHQTAFGEQKGAEISSLVKSLLDDKTAHPHYSFVAVQDNTIIGHILFTGVSVIGASPGLSSQILAPLAVLPDHRGKGVGTMLINTGLDVLRQHGVDLVFVLGHPGYYPRCNFIPAGKLGFFAPYPIPEEHSGAWMVRELSPGILGAEKGTVQCAESLNKPEHWRE